jgi:hypothetical protein
LALLLVFAPLPLVLLLVDFPRGTLPNPQDTLRSLLNRPLLDSTDLS